MTVSLNATALHETPTSISEWAVATFGSSGSDLRVLSRANEEMSETLRAATAEKPFAEIAEEAIDTMIVLCRYASRIGAELDVSVRMGAVRAPRHEQIIESAILANRHMAKLMLGTLRKANEHRILATLWLKLREVVNTCGFEVQALMDAKMTINRQREWKRDGTGHGYHVRDKSVNPQPR